VRAPHSGKVRFWQNSVVGEWLRTTYSVEKHVNMLALVRSEEKADRENAAA
jgi:hypothetical protein